MGVFDEAIGELKTQDDKRKVYIQKLEKYKNEMIICLNEGLEELLRQVGD
ncbi:MAG: hypothetical protein K5678_04105 [Acetatifactor sp.]|nr:hypothetical protein [Acetatifactor sp.]